MARYIFVIAGHQRSKEFASDAQAIDNIVGILTASYEDTRRTFDDDPQIPQNIAQHLKETCWLGKLEDGEFTIVADGERLWAGVHIRHRANLA